MTEVLVERNWEEPLTDADMQIMFSNALGCLNIHRVDWSGSLLSADGRDLFCHYSAADAESARIALQQAGSPRGHVWAGSVHDAPGFTNDVLARANVLVSRRFEAPVGLEEVQAVEHAGASCLSTHRVHFVRTYLSTDRRRMISLYQAPDAESVRLALHDASMPVERVWAFRQFRP